jgi:hypothetical protein
MGMIALNLVTTKAAAKGSTNLPLEFICLFIQRHLNKVYQLDNLGAEPDASQAV